MATKYIVDNLTGQTITGSIYSPNITGAITNLPSPSGTVNYDCSSGTTFVHFGVERETEGRAEDRDR